MAVKISELTNRNPANKLDSVVLMNDANGTYIDRFDNFLPVYEVELQEQSGATDGDYIAYAFAQVAKAMHTVSNTGNCAIAAGLRTTGQISMSGSFSCFLTPTACRFLYGNGATIFTGLYAFSNGAISYVSVGVDGPSSYSGTVV